MNAFVLSLSKDLAKDVPKTASQKARPAQTASRPALYSPAFVWCGLSLELMCWVESLDKDTLAPRTAKQEVVQAQVKSAALQKDAS